MIKAAKRAGQKCAVLYIGLDGFKNINDSLGHVAGDQLLKEVSKRLKGCLREADIIARAGEDIVARVGGNEFIIALSEISEVRGVERIVNVAEKIRGAVSNGTFAIDAHYLSVTTSIGVASILMTAPTWSS